MSKGFLEAIQQACQLRAAFIEVQEKLGTSAFRLFCGVKEGIDGFVIEKFGSVLVFQYHEGKCNLKDADLKLVCEWLGQKFPIKAIYLKRFMSDRSHSTIEGKDTPEQLFWGTHTAEKIEIQENRLRYWIKPAEGLSTGIFLDQRENRKFLSEKIEPKEALNCFSYTCAFSVALAKRGATVTSVDLSKKYLEWGKENFLLNDLDPLKHLFYAQDCFDYFKMAQKKGRRYGLIILDPPSFARGAKGRVFSVKKDMEELISQSIPLLVPGGTLFVSTNFAQWEAKALRETCRSVAERLATPVRWLEAPLASVDFTWEAHPLSVCIFKRLG